MAGEVKVKLMLEPDMDMRALKEALKKIEDQQVQLKASMSSSGAGGTSSTGTTPLGGNYGTTTTAGPAIAAANQAADSHYRDLLNMYFSSGKTTGAAYQAFASIEHNRLEELRQKSGGYYADKERSYESKRSTEDYRLHMERLRSVTGGYYETRRYEAAHRLDMREANIRLERERQKKGGYYETRRYEAAQRLDTKEAQIRLEQERQKKGGYYETRQIEAKSSLAKAMMNYRLSTLGNLSSGAQHILGGNIMGAASHFGGGMLKLALAGSIAEEGAGAMSALGVAGLGLAAIPVAAAAGTAAFGAYMASKYYAPLIGSYFGRETSYGNWDYSGFIGTSNAMKRFAAARVALGQNIGSPKALSNLINPDPHWWSTLMPSSWGQAVGMLTGGVAATVTQNGIAKGSWIGAMSAEHMAFERAKLGGGAYASPSRYIGTLAYAADNLSHTQLTQIFGESHVPEAYLHGPGLKGRGALPFGQYSAKQQDTLLRNLPQMDQAMMAIMSQNVHGPESYPAPNSEFFGAAAGPKFLDKYQDSENYVDKLKKTLDDWLDRESAALIPPIARNGSSIPLSVNLGSPASHR